MNKNRKILHCDLNNFYASVELLSYPELKNKPVAVSGNPTNRHGIILSKNEVAKKFNVKTAETVNSAKRKCPELILLPANRDKYFKYSSYVRNIFLSYTELTEPFGIDEAWLDVTGSELVFGKPEKIAYEIKDRIKKELGLTVSIGVSFNKIFAKIGSDYKKPDAVTVINELNYKEIIYPMPVESLLFVGSKTKEALRDMNIITMGDLAKVKRTELISHFGKYGNNLFDMIAGNSDDEVRNYYNIKQAKSIGNGKTFAYDIKTEKEIKNAILILSEKISKRLRSVNMLCNCVKITLKTPGFISFDRQRKLQKSTDVTNDIYKTAVELFEDSWKYPTSVRMFAVSVSGLSKEGSGDQLDLFSNFSDVSCNNEFKYKKLDIATDKIRDRYGMSSIDYLNTAQKQFFPDIDMDYEDIE